MDMDKRVKFEIETSNQFKKKVEESGVTIDFLKGDLISSKGYIIAVKTDEGRARLEAIEGTLLKQLIQICTENNFINYFENSTKLSLSFQSQETIDREYGGEWRHYFA